LEPIKDKPPSCRNVHAPEVRRIHHPSDCVVTWYVFRLRFGPVRCSVLSGFLEPKRFGNTQTADFDHRGYDVDQAETHVRERRAPDAEECTPLNANALHAPQLS
jgi:hypothetical protein